MTGMPFRHSRGCAALLLLMQAVAAPAALPPPLDRIIHSQKMPESAVSLYVEDLDDDQQVAALNAQVPRNPASVFKLVTTFVALDLLGPTYTWPTKFHALGPIENGTLQGDLLIKGYGDPYLVEEDFWKALGELSRRGIHHITGDLIVDDSHFAVSASDPGAFDGQPYRLYNVLPNALMVNFKALNFVFTPVSTGHGVAIETVPSLDNLTIDNQLRLSDGPCRGVLSTFSMTVTDPVAADRVVFNGDYQRSCGTQSLPRTMLQPWSYTYGLFRTFWRQWGGSIDGTIRRGIAPPAKTPFLVWHSRPLAELIRPLNKWSNNIMANSLLYTLGDTMFSPPLTEAQGAAVIHQYFSAHKLDATGMVIENGSGLSRKTRISAQSLIELLHHAYHGPYMAEFIASMSIVGMDGTMHRRFKKRPEAGHMHVKTGHLNDVAALAGYVSARSGKTYAIVLIINHPRVNSGFGNDFQNALLQWLYQR